MFLDKDGWPCFIDIDGRLNHWIRHDEDECFTYENIIKNLGRLDFDNCAHLKRFFNDGTFSGQYFYMSEESIKLIAKKYPKSRRLNPEIYF